MDDVAYWHEPWRIVYLLEKVNVADGEDAWDLPSFLGSLLHASRRPTWNMVAYWTRRPTWNMVAHLTFGLRNGLPRWADVPQAGEEFRRSWLRRRRDRAAGAFRP